MEKVTLDCDIQEILALIEWHDKMICAICFDIGMKNKKAKHSQRIKELILIKDETWPK